MAIRGDVVIMDFPFTDQPGRKRRPAVVVQADVYNQMIAKTMVAMITGNLRRSGNPAHLLVDPGALDGASSGLRSVSLISCTNLVTVEQSDVVKTLGHLSDALKLKLESCLKAALELP